MKKFLKFLGVIPLAITMMIGLTGCFGGDPGDNGEQQVEPPHVHEYDNRWTYNNTHHWHEPLCNDTTEIADKAEHKLIAQVLREPDCHQEGAIYYYCETCRYTTDRMEIEKTPHTYSTDWTCLADVHVHKCTFCGDRTDATPHNYVNGKCDDCGYTDGNRNFSYVTRASSEGVWVIIKGIKDTTLENIVIPSHFDGVEVGEIETEAFKNNNNLKSITIPDTVKTIGNKAFYYCKNLTTVNLGKGLKAIGVEAFFACNNLETINFPDGLVTIERSAFVECRKLQTINLPSTVKTIGEDAFRYCRTLSTLTLPDGLEEVNNIIEYCENLTYNEYSNGYYLGSKTNPYMVLVKQKDNNISDITINEECKFVYYNALRDCSNLTSVVIPSKVTKIYRGALRNCTSLTNLTVSEDNEYFSSERNVIYNKEKTVLLLGAGGIDTLVVPSQVTEIADYAFSGAKLRFLNLENVKIIGKYAFENCSIQNLELNDDLTTISEGAFYNCKEITTVNIPVSVTQIGVNAFYGSGLTYVTYDGTAEQWNKIKVNKYSFPQLDNFTIQCSNGNVVYNETTEE